jgi:hypothetical protein
MREDVSNWGRTARPWQRAARPVETPLGPASAPLRVRVEALSKCFDGRLGIRGRPLLARTCRKRERHSPCAERTSRRSASACPHYGGLSPQAERTSRHSGADPRRTESASPKTVEDLSEKREDRSIFGGRPLATSSGPLRMRRGPFERARGSLPGTERLSAKAEPSTLQPYRAVLSPFRDDRSPFRDDRAASVVSVSSTWRA